MAAVVLFEKLLIGWKAVVFFLHLKTQPQRRRPNKNDEKMYVQSCIHLCICFCSMSLYKEIKMKQKQNKNRKMEN